MSGWWVGILLGPWMFLGRVSQALDWTRQSHSFGIRLKLVPVRSGGGFGVRFGIGAALVGCLDPLFGGRE